MSLMNAELYQALRSAQVPDDQATAAAQSVVSPEGLATKVDMAELRTELAALRGELSTEIAAVRGDLRAEMHALGRRIIMWNTGTLIAVASIVFAIVRWL